MSRSTSTHRTRQPLTPTLSQRERGKCRRALVCAALLLITSCSSLRAEPIHIEVPLFEGGSGRDWYIYAARAYELQGRWRIELTSGPEKLTDSIDIALAPTGTKQQPDDLTAAVTLADDETVVAPITGKPDPRSDA